MAGIFRRPVSCFAEVAAYYPRALMPPRTSSRPLVTSIAALLCTIQLTGAAEISAAAPDRSGLKPPERVAAPQLAAASSEPEKAMKKFTVPAGFDVSVWAAEPMLGNPVAFTIDDQGRAFVAETYRYRTSTLDIRHYMFMLEDDLACRTTDDRIAQYQKELPQRVAEARARDGSRAPRAG